MLLLLEGPRVSPGKVFVMSIIAEEKKVAPQAAASSKKKNVSNVFEGKVVSVTGSKLVMTSKLGTDYSHTLAKDAKVTCDGTICKPEDLKAGKWIRVTTNRFNRNVATAVECLDKNAEFAQPIA